MPKTMKRFALALLVLSTVFASIIQYRTTFAQAGSGYRGDLEPTAFSPSTSNSTGNKMDEGAKHRLREGTTVSNRLGRFQQSGGRATFVTENGLELGGLPNLNLERVVRMLKSAGESESIWWSVSGTITEFSGRNYILISRAVYKSASPPPSPEKLAE